jgi:hypothetical protein
VRKVGKAVNGDKALGPEISLWHSFKLAVMF